MAGHWTDVFSFTTGVVRDRNTAYFALTHDATARKKSPHSAITAWVGGKWNNQMVEWGVVGVACIEFPEPLAFYLGEPGGVHVFDGTNWSIEEFAHGDDGTDKRGPLRALRTIAGQPYAAGMDRQVYRRNGPNRWELIDQGARPEKFDPRGIGFNAIDGFAPNDIYAAGFQGQIWHYNGKRWRQLDSPTNYILSNLICAPDGNVYACGRLGMLVRGRGDQWEVIDHQATKQDIWGFAWFQDKLYLASLHFLFAWDGTALKPIELDDPNVSSTYHLCTSDGFLWSIGAKDVVGFDGKDWERID